MSRQNRRIRTSALMMGMHTHYGIASIYVNGKLTIPALHVQPLIYELIWPL